MGREISREERHGEDTKQGGPSLHTYAHVGQILERAIIVVRGDFGEEDTPIRRSKIIL